MQEKQMKIADQRTRLMSELLNNIKGIKLYNWESFFMSRILSVRNDQELKLLRSLGIMTVCRLCASFSEYRNSRQPSVHYQYDLGRDSFTRIIQLLRRCRVYIPETTHLRYRFPGDFSVFAALVSFGYGTLI